MLAFFGAARQTTHTDDDDTVDCIVSGAVDGGVTAELVEATSELAGKTASCSLSLWSAPPAAAKRTPESKLFPEPLDPPPLDK